MKLAPPVLRPPGGSDIEKIAARGRRAYAALNGARTRAAIAITDMTAGRAGDARVFAVETSDELPSAADK